MKRGGTGLSLLALLVAAIVGGVVGGIVVREWWKPGNGSSSTASIQSVCQAAKVADQALPRW